MTARSLLAIGTGVGIQIHNQDLVVTVVRVRPSGARVLGHLVISGFGNRPATDWGAEYAAFLRRTGAADLAATVLLPRQEVIVRHLALPGVAERDLASAVPLQIDALHPYGEDEADYAWGKLPGGESVLIGIALKTVVERYSRLFIEAGIKIASFTFSAAVLYSALRVFSEGLGEDFLAISGGTEMEAYGESKAKPLFSALMEEPVKRSAAWCASELRLPPGTELKGIEQILPAPVSAGAGLDLAQAGLSYATALVSACPRGTVKANLLPVELRSTNSRLMLVPTVGLAVILLALATTLAAQRTYEERRRLDLLQAEIARYAPQAAKAAETDKSIQSARDRARQLDLFHSHTRADMNVLLEITRLIEPPAWVNNLEMDRGTVTIGGQCEQAAPLLKLLDSSPYFRDSEFVGQIGKAEKNQVFRIRMVREGAAE